MKILILIIIAFPFSVFADCTTELMSPPTCIDRLNASRFCGNGPGASEEVLSTVRDCFKHFESFPKKNIITVCLAGYTSSSKDKDKETLCTPEGKAIVTPKSAVNDSEILKEPQTLSEDEDSGKAVSSQ